jgi:hypothetical protein
MHPKPLLVRLWMCRIGTEKCSQIVFFQPWK